MSPESPPPPLIASPCYDQSLPAGSLPVPADSEDEPNTLLSTKRGLSEDSIARTRHVDAKRIRRNGHDDDCVDGRTRSISPGLFGALSSSPSSILHKGHTVTRHSRYEDMGSNRTLRMARGTPGSPVPMPSSPRSTNHQTHNHTTLQLRSNDGRNNSKSVQLFNSVALTEFLQQDERPVFVADIGEESLQYEGLSLLFANVALRARPQLLDCVEGRAEDAALLLDLGTPFYDFRAWVLGQPLPPDVIPSFPFAGMVWKSATIRKRLKVVTAHADHINHEATRPGLTSYQGLSNSSSTIKNSVHSSEQIGYFDIKPSPRVKSSTLANVQSLVTASFPEDSPSSDGALPSASTSNGTITTPDLLTDDTHMNLDHQQNQILIKNSNTENLEGMSMQYLANKGFFDWTRLPMSPSLPEHIHFARSVDWGATSLGPIEKWSADLRGMCNLIMASPHPAAMYWGPEHVAIYNEAYIVLAGQKHPGLMGSKYSDAWSEIWDAIGDVFAVAMTSAQATMKDDDLLFIDRNGYLEETYFSWSIIPLIGPDGSVVGLYNPAFEKTRRKIAERRMLTLREIGERTATARAVSQFWAMLVEGLQYNEYDAPLVIIYSLIDGEESDAASSASSTAAASKVCHLEGALGVEVGHAAAPPTIDLKHDNTGFASFFKRAITTDRPIVLSTDDESLDPNLLKGVNWRGFGDPSRTVVVSPIRPTTGESTLGFLVMGTNPRRPYDEDYDLFIQLLGRQLATSVASVVLFEEEIRKGERAAQMAAQDRIELSNQLAARTQEAVESENKFTRMAELAPVGMFIGDSDGKITFANDAWYKISSYPTDQPINNEWFEYLNEEDQSLAREHWRMMVKRKSHLSLEFRFKTPWRDKPGSQTQTWVLASASPEKDEDGNITRIFGSMTDISNQKFAEALQKKRVEEAIEMKRQQERYIDTTSHEMRNPLSAILQSADSISNSLTELCEASSFSPAQIEVLETSIDSAQTITLCAQHQKRIVDDVLTLSKLDSAMLLVTPVDAQPVIVVRRALKMFEGELQTADIALDVRIDKSYENLQLDWVRLDPTRLSQVLINLTTNAIKFTTTQEKRTIKMHVAASKQKPSSENKWRLTYIPSQSPKDHDVTAGPEWGMGESVYIHFAVQDTGRGLTESERKQLFQRFSQGNPRTHVHYGGSGLGLFISRELVELQGGEIGVASESGKGSTFAFYVKARRSQAPASGSEDDMASDGYQSRKGSKSIGPSKLGPSKPKTQSLASSSTVPETVSNATAQKAGSRLPESLRVLIVEDNLINQKVLASQLRKIGCTVYVANHGGEAIEQIKQSTFYQSPRPHPSSGQPIDISVVLMDLEMPVMDGQTCARELRKMQHNGELVRHIPVIAVTANAREEQIRNTLEAGIDDVVSKPFRIPELVPKMKDVIARFSDLAIDNNNNNNNNVRSEAHENTS